MRKTEIIADLVQRHIPLSASPEARAGMYREIVNAVKAAGRLAEPAWLLTRMDDGDLLTAFAVQVRALETAARAPAEPAAPTHRKLACRPAAGRRTAPRDGDDDEG